VLDGNSIVPLVPCAVDVSYSCNWGAVFLRLDEEALLKSCATDVSARTTIFRVWGFFTLVCIELEDL